MQIIFNLQVKLIKDLKKELFGDINSYEKTISCLFERKNIKKTVYYLIQAFVLIFNYATLLINGTNFARFLFTLFAEEEIKDFVNSFIFYKLITIVLMILLMLIIKSSEYLKIPSLLSTVIIISSLIIFWIKNLNDFGIKNIYNMDAFKVSGMLPLISSQVYSIESIGTLLTIRQAMKRPKQISSVIKQVFAFSLILFVLNGLSFNISFTSPKEIAFEYYNSENTLIMVLKFAFYLTLPATMTIAVFAVLTTFESIDCLEGKFGVEKKKKIMNREGNGGEIFENQGDTKGI